jgi:hypothetical protein
VLEAHGPAVDEGGRVALGLGARRPVVAEERQVFAGDGDPECPRTWIGGGSNAPLESPPAEPAAPAEPLDPVIPPLPPLEAVVESSSPQAAKATRHEIEKATLRFESVITVYSCETRALAANGWKNEEALRALQGMTQLTA